MVCLRLKKKKKRSNLDMQKPMIPFFNNNKKKNLKFVIVEKHIFYLPRHWGHRLWNDEVKPCIFLLKRRWDLASTYQQCLCPCLHLVEPAHSSNKYVRRMSVYIYTCLHLVEPAHSSNKYVRRMSVYIYICESHQSHYADIYIYIYMNLVIHVSLYILVSKKRFRSWDGNANLNDSGMVLSCEVISPFVENLMLLIINFSLLKSMLYLGFHAFIHHLITYLKLIISGVTNPYMLRKKHLIWNFDQLIKFILIYLFLYVGKIH